MRIAQALKEKLMDVRLRDKLIAEGKVTKEDVEKYLHELEDQTTKLLYTDQVEPQAPADQPRQGGQRGQNASTRQNTLPRKDHHRDLLTETLVKLS